MAVNGKPRKIDYTTWSQPELIREIKKLEKRKKYGLIWDDERIKEVFEEEVQKKLPVLKDVTKNGIEDTSKPNNILIEGDNYHTLSVLRYTHKGKIDVIYIDPPYNTGARDWQYNNNYVDENDGYRHSKWISFMSKRLELAKHLLKKDGVLIVTIDDHELFSLLGLLEKLHAKILGITCIVIKPEGRRQSQYIMESHEYAIFSTWGMPKLRGLDVDFGLDFPEEDDEGKFRWEGFMRRDAGREDRGSDYWFPFYVSKKGEISLTKQSGYSEILPINTKGIERVWLWDKKRSLENLDKLNATIRKDRITIYYKRRKMRRMKPTSVWFGSKYNANAYGTRILTSILPKTKFNFPKSLYAVLDCIDLFLPEDGIVLDFFAGSGTTGHAVLQLNKKDGGNRKFILCTNNENNICTDVCYPRLKKVIKGYKNSKGEKVEGFGGNLKYFKTSFVDWKFHTDQNKKTMVEKSTEMLCLKEDCFELVKEENQFKIFKNHNGKYLGIIYYYDGIELFKKEILKLKKKINTYVFSLTDEIDDEEFMEVDQLVTLKPIPSAILNVYRRIFAYVQTKKLSGKTRK